MPACPRCAGALIVPEGSNAYCVACGWGTSLDQVAEMLELAHREGFSEDTPEGRRYVQMSDTLVARMAETIRTGADTIAKLTRQVAEIRGLTLGWAWAEACIQLDRGDDPRQQEMPLLLERADAELAE